MEFISPEGLRQDGRRPHELRQLRCEIGLLSKADGSASFEMGNTKVFDVDADIWQGICLDHVLIQCIHAKPHWKIQTRARLSMGVLPLL